MCIQEFVYDAVLAGEFLIERITVIEMQDLNHAWFIAPLALTGDSSLVASKVFRKYSALPVSYS